MNINVADLRRGNLVMTEYGILPVKHLCFDGVYVKGEDGRVLYAKRVSGISLNSEVLPDLIDFEKAASQLKDLVAIYKDIDLPDSGVDYVHELQNWYYWNSGKKELELKVKKEEQNMFDELEELEQNREQ